MNPDIVSQINRTVILKSDSIHEPKSTTLKAVVPETQVPLNFLGLKCLDTISLIVIFLPGNLGPSSGGVIITTAKAIRPITDKITYKKNNKAAKKFLTENSC